MTQGSAPPSCMPQTRMTFLTGSTRRSSSSGNWSVSERQRPKTVSSLASSAEMRGMPARRERMLWLSWLMHHAAEIDGYAERAVEALPTCPKGIARRAHKSRRDNFSAPLREVVLPKEGPQRPRIFAQRSVSARSTLKAYRLGVTKTRRSGEQMPNEKAGRIRLFCPRARGSRGERRETQ